ncbi:unnamed protein product, partial [Plutella xylostella]
IILLIDIQPQRVNPQPQLRVLLVADLEVVDSVHLEVLSYLEVLHHGILAQHPAMLLPPVADALLPFLAGHLRRGEESGRVQRGRVVSVARLHGVRREKDRGLRRAVDLVRQDRVLN